LTAGVQEGNLLGVTRSHNHEHFNPSTFNSAVAIGMVLVALFLQPGCRRHEAEQGGTNLPRLDATDLTGNPVDPIYGITNRAVVLVFVDAECPISNRYAPEIRRLYTRFGPRGMRFWLVYPNRDLSVQGIRQHTTDFKLDCGVLLDQHHTLVHRAKVKVTPEVAVFAAEGRLVYRGRLDDRYVAFHETRPEATHHDLEEALGAILEAKPIPTAITQATGCAIPDL